MDWLHRGVQGLGSVFSGYPKSLVFNFQVVLVTVTVWQYFCGLTCTLEVKPLFFSL